MQTINSNIIMAGGIVLLLLVIFSVLTGLGFIKSSAKAHKISGILILLLSIIHAFFGMIYLVGN